MALAQRRADTANLNILSLFFFISGLTVSQLKFYLKFHLRLLNYISTGRTQQQIPLLRQCPSLYDIMGKFILYAALLLTFSCNSNSLESENYATKIDGEMVYKKNCANCHKIDTDYSGPALKYIFYKRNKEWVYTFLTNRSKIIDDSLQFRLKNLYKFNCKEFPDLSREEVYAAYNFCYSTGQDPPPK